MSLAAKKIQIPGSLVGKQTQIHAVRNAIHTLVEELFNSLETSQGEPCWEHLSLFTYQNDDSLMELELLVPIIDVDVLAGKQ